MSKPYFTKYLPVEGELQIGKYYWNKQHLTGDLVANHLHLKILQSGKFQPAKLFLCSRDIQVGDIAYNDKFHPYPNGDLCDTNSKVMDHGMTTPDSFKVVGEVLTPNIKEGQEFTEKEIEFLTIGEIIS